MQHHAKHHHRTLRRQRGVAMLLVLITVAMASVLSLSFLTAQSTSAGISQNVKHHAQARAIAESGLDLAANFIRTDANWRTELTPGNWIADQPLAGGTFSIAIYDGYDEDGDGQIDTDNDLADDPADRVTLIATGKYQGVIHRVQCVLTPQAVGGTRVLLVVGDANALSAADQIKRNLLRTLGYQVNIIDDGANSSAYAAALEQNDVVYISEAASAGSVNNKLTDTTLGVVCEQGYLNDDLLVSSQNGPATAGSKINVVNTSHYITSEFSTGSLTITTESQSLRKHSGTLASGATTLAKENGGSTPSLVTLDANANNTDSDPSSGRRVLLPWGDGDFDVSLLTDDGQTLLKRALDWAAGAGASSGGAAFGVNVIGSVSLKGNARIDALDSTSETYSPWSYASGNATIATNATGNKDVELKNSATIQGDVYVGPNGDPDKVIDTSGSATVTGSATALGEALSLSDIPAPSGLPDSDGDYKTPNWGTVTFSAGTYHYDKFTVSNDAQVEIEGNVTIYCDEKFEIKNGGRVILNENATLTLYADDFDLKNDCKLNMPGGNPANLTMYCHGDNDIKVDNSAHVAAVILAPNAGLDIKNDGKVFGSFQGQFIDLKNSGRFTQDLALQSGAGAGSGDGGGDSPSATSYTYARRWIEQ